MSLVVEALTCTRAGRTLFAPVSVSVQPEGALVLRGPNGAGKTTLLRALAGLMPFEGAATLNATPVGQAEGMIAYAGHLDAIKPSLTVRENLEFWAGLLGHGSTRTALDQFDLVRLADRPAGRLSAGQRRRLGLARLTLTGATLWLLDEPTNSLDAENSARLTDIIRDHLADGGLAVVATHVPLGLDAPVLELEPATQSASADPFLEGTLA